MKNILLYFIKKCILSAMKREMICNIYFSSKFLVNLRQCVDISNSDDCKKWKKAGDCSVNAFYYSFMSMNCRRTCGYCYGKGIPNIFL